MVSRLEEVFRRLIAFDTTSHRSPEPLVDFVCEVLERPGVRAVRQPGHEDGKSNLVVEIGPETGTNRGGLVLCGHMDVVPATEPEWESDPFELVRRGDRYYGRGVADMKGFVALMVDAATRVDPDRLRQPLVLLLTYDEEIGTIGARHFFETWPGDRPLPRRVVIGEPTERTVVLRHKGHLKARVTVDGESAHSAYPHLGRNAIEPAAELVLAWRTLRCELEKMQLPSSVHFAEVPFPSMNVATIHGGSAINVIPDRCVVEVGVRLLPGQDSDVVADRLRAVAAEALEDASWTWELLCESPPLEASGGDLAQTLIELVGGEPESVLYATDAGWLQRLDMDCVVWGPGSIRVAHKPNEWIAASELESAATTLDDLVERFCSHTPS